VATPDEAEAILGNVEDLNSKMRGYVNDSNRKRVQMDVQGVPDLTLPEGTPVSTLDALLGIATVCLDAGIHLERVHELLDSAAKEAGGDARVTALRARLAARRANDAELEKNLALLTTKADDLLGARRRGPRVVRACPITRCGVGEAKRAVVTQRDAARSIARVPRG
jgi:hypothetical protein